jgi:hypothetical protein
MVQSRHKYFMSEIRKLINIVSEAPDPLKKEIINTVRSIDDETLLYKVLNTLKAGNIEERIASVIGHDADAKAFLERITEIIVKIPAPVEEKNAFLDQYSKGIINTKLLLGGKANNFLQLVGGNNFAKELFKILSTTLVSQGVGPGEVALAVLSPEIKWSGRAVGGGDVQIGKLAVEVKTSVSSGGRWINARKARMNMAGIEQAIVDAEIETLKKVYKQKNPMPMGLPARLNPEYWVTKVRPQIDPKFLEDCVEHMANGLFNHVDNSQYQTALYNGSAAEIKEAILAVGFENYKAYSHFDGILMMDVGSETARYFKDYDSMAGSIKSDTPYIYAPEAEGMPKVSLMPVEGVSATPAKGKGKPGSVPAQDDTPAAMKNPEASMSADDIAPDAPAEPKPLADRIGRRKRA